MGISVNSWYHSPGHGQLCQLIYMLWADTRYRGWIDGSA